MNEVFGSSDMGWCHFIYSSQRLEVLYFMIATFFSLFPHHPCYKHLDLKNIVLPVASKNCAKPVTTGACTSTHVVSLLKSCHSTFRRQCTYQLKYLTHALQYLANMCNNFYGKPLMRCEYNWVRLPFFPLCYIPLHFLFFPWSASTHLRRNVQLLIHVILLHNMLSYSLMCHAVLFD